MAETAGATEAAETVETIDAAPASSTIDFGCTRRPIPRDRLPPDAKKSGRGGPQNTFLIKTIFDESGYGNEAGL